jgi:hypothetical protein
MEDALNKELAETKDQVRILRERTTEVRDGEQPLSPQGFCFVVVVPRK